MKQFGRMRDIRVFMLANSVTITNPYFLFFDIKLPYNSDIATYKNGLILVQYMKNEEYRQEKKKSKFRQVNSSVHLSKNTRLIMNLSLTTIILLRKNKVRQNSHLPLFIKVLLLACGLILNCGKIFISKDYDKNTPFLFSCSLEDHSDNTMFLKSAKKYNCWKRLIENFELGNVRFENQQIKNISMQLFKTMLLF